MIEEAPSPRSEIASGEPGVALWKLGEGWDLWSSKELQLLWLDCEDHWTVPSLHDHDPEQNVTSSVTFCAAWFWPVNVVFGGWCIRTLRKAKQLNADLPSGTYPAFRVVREYIETRHPGCWPEVERLADAAASVKLPAIPQTCIELAQFGLLPRWRGWEKHAAKDGAAVGASPSTGEPAPAASVATAQKSRRVKAPDRPGLF